MLIKRKAMNSYHKTDFDNMSDQTRAGDVPQSGSPPPFITTSPALAPGHHNMYQQPSNCCTTVHHHHHSGAGAPPHPVTAAAGGVNPWYAEPPRLYGNVVPTPLLQRHPALVQCPGCRDIAVTSVRHVQGKGTHWMATFFFVFTVVGTWIPYASNHFKNAEHSCSRCGRVLAVQRFGGGTKAVLMHVERMVYANDLQVTPLSCNTGIGYEVAKALAASPTAYRIIIGCRDTAKGDAAVSRLTTELPSPTASSFAVVQCDLTSDASLEAAAATLARQFDRIDALVNNAGAAPDMQTRPDPATGVPSAAALRKGYNETWDVNVTGTHILTTLLVPLLLRSPDPRLLFLTSGTASLAETERRDGPMFARINAAPEDKGWPKKVPNPGMPLSGMPSAYRAAKVGLNMLMREWARVLHVDGVKVWSISPGFLATGLGGAGADILRKIGAGEPHKGGEFIRDVIEGKRDGDAGKAIRVDSVQAF
ncbi:hypothetical protein Micbo1qcDRAFT_235767 [Microdochium bolleyi]|uniref:LITAF domain-containing protein n=1 Tax=Microdochium bolleyi TaxID=196109 RepID=A0A136IU42_9PEZI|nr:hypothetical protein Micbo1qcDRAFT_235767 [Microdochium bolleyi]